ncbi:hypothetical protein ERJ75_001244500 [Trypanosoma vivax]|uniref:Rubisco LSMT substrate-binding domain-containing protein n=1 Tax=Trypanosoma vivax (strain Y486) TaxID=1055687 RepID=G0TWG7_TRYVY|nr:hypothetical protein ERJ75_001244500 [Trypanosoma vivax]CCC48305.1 conserved hypothetical protein [Trypanosoma vivax Y486]
MDEDLVEWFVRAIDGSDCAYVKRQYVNCSVIMSDTVDDFSRLLWMCRIIVSDQCVVWEHLSDNFTETFKSYIDGWNEQLAVKLLQQRLCTLSEGARKSVLCDQLRRHLDNVVKPHARSVCGRSTAEVEGVEHGSCLIVPATESNEGCIVCNASLPPFGELLRIPRERLFFLDTVVKYCDLGRAIHTSPELSELVGGEEQLLILALIYERFVVDLSHWHELLVACPSEYPTVPSYWEFDDLSELHGLDVLDDVLTKRARVHDFYSEIMLVLPVIHSLVAGSSGLEREEFLRRFSVENIMWARATFDSRAFNLNVDGRTLLALVPNADMVNHSNRADVLVRMVEPDGGDFVMRIGAGLTQEDIGRELSMSYGPLQNWELLQHYGFVLEDNEHDKLPFPLDLPGTADEDRDEWDARRAVLIEKYALHLVGRCWIGHSGVPPAALVALLRIYLAEVEEFDTLERRGPFSAVSENTEMKVVALIEETVRCILGFSIKSPDEGAEGERDGDGDGTDERSDEASGSVQEAEEADAQRNKGLCRVLRAGLERIGNRALQWCAARTCAPSTSLECAINTPQ